MQSIVRLPRMVLVIEAIGGLMILAALLLVNRWLPALGTLSTGLFITGIVLMLPAAWLLMWHTAKVIAP